MSQYSDRAELAKRLLQELQTAHDTLPCDHARSIEARAIIKSVIVEMRTSFLDRASAGEGGEAQPQVAMTDEVREILEDAANKMQAVVRSITDQFPHAHNTIAMLETWSAEVRSNVARTLPAPQASGEEELRFEVAAAIAGVSKELFAKGTNTQINCLYFDYADRAIAAFRRLSPSANLLAAAKGARDALLNANSGLRDRGIPLYVITIRKLDTAIRNAGGE